MKPRILVVDDEMDIVDLLAFNFKKPSGKRSCQPSPILCYNL